MIDEEVKGAKSYLLAEVERWDIGLVNVMRHSMSSPARNTGPRAMEATTSIICNQQRYDTEFKTRSLTRRTKCNTVFCPPS